MADPVAVANAFVTHYYTLFDSSRGALKGLYRDGSILSFEGELFVGAEAIATKLTVRDVLLCLMFVDSQVLLGCPQSQVHRCDAFWSEHGARVGVWRVDCGRRSSSLDLHSDVPSRACGLRVVCAQ
jgi:hypothetical protein